MIRNRKVNIFYQDSEIDHDFWIDFFVRQIKKEISQLQHNEETKDTKQ